MKSIFNSLSLLFVVLAFFLDAITAQTFRGNSKRMVDKVVDDSPFFLRKKIKAKLMKQLGNGKISEKDVIAALKITTPSLFLSSALEKVKKLQS